MTTTKKQEKGQAQKKYLWFGFGNYGGQPVQQIGGGIVRDPNLFDNTVQNSAVERSPLVYVARAVLGFTLFVIVLVGVLSLLIR